MQLGIVVMSWSEEVEMMKKFVEHGACDFLIKPVRIKELRNIWQHVFRKQIGCQNKGDFRYTVGRITANILEIEQQNLAQSAEESDEIIADSRLIKKTRLHWTRQLHNQFLSAVNTLGIEKAVPKIILEVMNVPGLTREQVASHLQKYRQPGKRARLRMAEENVGSTKYSYIETVPSFLHETSYPLLTHASHIKSTTMMGAYNCNMAESLSGSHCTGEGINNGILQESCAWDVDFAHQYNSSSY